MLCPRRSEIGGGAEVFKLMEGDDTWRGDEGSRTCSWCGSLHPDDFMAKSAAGIELGPTDKAYKVYVGDGGKFYFQHLSSEQRSAFVDLLNGKRLKLGYPGYFYRLPFFVGPVKPVSG